PYERPESLPWHRTSAKYLGSCWFLGAGRGFGEGHWPSPSPSPLYLELVRVCWIGHRPPGCAERCDRVFRPPVDRQLAQNLADQAGELEAVGGAVGNQDLRVLRQRIDHEVTVGRHIIQAGLCVQHRPERAGDVGSQELPHALLAGHAWLKRARLG